MRQTGIQIPVECKLFVLGFSNMAENDPQDFYYYDPRALQDFFPNFGVGYQLKFDNGEKLYSETYLMDMKGPYTPQIAKIYGGEHVNLKVKVQGII